MNSNAGEVELFLNGKSLGKKAMPRNKHLQWEVPYQPGVLKLPDTTPGARCGPSGNDRPGLPDGSRTRPDHPSGPMALPQL
ncbi:MAG: DUF4982 domain-containing protein [Haliscomenobacter sp.]|nr:DUF4982 domain-containing protein [Haliscomenobacter sp.]